VRSPYPLDEETHLLLTSLALTFVSVAPIRVQTEGELQAGLVETRALLDKRSWAPAEKRLLELAALHEKTPHIWLHLPQLRESLQLAGFWRSYAEPKPADVVPGELLSYSEVSGALKLRFRGSETLRFEAKSRQSSTQVDVKLDGLFDLDDSRVRVHPAVFAGPYSIEITGKSYSPAGLASWTPTTVLLIYDEGQLARVSFGGLVKPTARRTEPVGGFVIQPAQFDGSYPAKIEVQEGETWRELDSRDPSPCEAGKPFKFKVSVSETRVTATYNGKPLLAADKPAQKFGQVGLAQLSNADEIALQGRVHTSFVRGPLDQHLTDAWKQHLKQHPVARALPKALTPKSAGDDRTVNFDSRELPSPVPAAKAEWVNKILGAKPAEVDSLLAELGTLGDDSAPEDTRAWLAAFLHAKVAKLRPALASAERVLQLQPEFAPALRLKGWLLARLYETDRAVEAYRAFLERDPDNDRAAGALGEWLFVSGRLAELEALLRERAARSRFTRELDELNMRRWRAENGPSWKDPFVVETEHYRVVTDIDLKTCKLAADLLESSVRRFEARLRPLPAEGARRFPVYLFSGQAGYERYLSEGLDMRVESTAGIYHLGLRQLLIWNLPDRTAMFETVRHEGLHQYLHRWIAEPPVWLNEGLAEFYENAQFHRPPSQEIQLHPGHLETLQTQRNTLPSLETFVRLEPAGFYPNAQLHYAQAWAFVHMLLTTTPERRKLFDALLDAGAEGASASEAIELVFGGLDLRALDAALLEHVDALAAPKSKR
jgi:tetratricopeptide (TPR) repeat protein